MDLYKFAAQRRLRFPTNRGSLTVEQLFDLPLKDNGGFDLNTIAKDINAQVKASGEESFVEDTTLDPAKEVLTVSLDIVKDVIKTKQEESNARVKQAKKNIERRRLLDLLDKKKNEAEGALSIDELQQKLEELDAE